MPVPCSLHSLQRLSALGVDACRVPRLPGQGRVDGDWTRPKEKVSLLPGWLGASCRTKDS